MISHNNMFVVYVYIICFFYKMYHVKYFLSVWSNWLDWPPVVVFVAVLADDDHLSGISHLAIFLAANSLIIAFFSPARQPRLFPSRTEQPILLIRTVVYLWLDAAGWCR